jgi:hypothetical protein
LLTIVKNLVFAKQPTREEERRLRTTCRNNITFFINACTIPKGTDPAFFGDAFNLNVVRPPESPRPGELWL